MTDAHLAPGDVYDYWTPDASPDAVDRIDTHVFACGDCARLLRSARVLIEGLRETVRLGRFQAVVTDAVLNRLARDGTRVRTFAVEPGAIVPCAIWPDDEVIAVRLRGDFTGLERVSVVTQVSGHEVDRITDVPVPPGAGELIEAFSAEQLRQVPRAQIRLRLFGSRGASDEALLAEYVLEHGGAMSRRT